MKSNFSNLFSDRKIFRRTTAFEEFYTADRTGSIANLIAITSKTDVTPLKNLDI